MATSELGQPDAIGASDPLPPEMRAAARKAYSCRWVEAGVASLVFDSWQDAQSRKGARYVVFRTDEVTVELALSEDRSLVGRLLPPSATDLLLRWPGGSSASRTDEFGCFTLPHLPPGPASLRFPAPSGGSSGPVGTEWTVF